MQIYTIFLFSYNLYKADSIIITVQQITENLCERRINNNNTISTTIIRNAFLSIKLKIRTHKWYSVEIIIYNICFRQHFAHKLNN